MYKTYTGYRPYPLVLLVILDVQDVLRVQTVPLLVLLVILDVQDVLRVQTVPRDCVAYQPRLRALETTDDLYPITLFFTYCNMTIQFVFTLFVLFSLEVCVFNACITNKLL